ncbi:hypothetical protein [Mucilaginibacter psychrotolerans]|uniref:Uncharacterized protein n=1 Tax=Mucilaginibacter psychrotolerans TaxID=1524096 RepID=A0A4Y8S5S3_9SPHI|nr:hypothetical protein [Mucilaginibacter psychrotolerans]TFF33754.1 hypothetical protein E2R66_24475 [Mucilaginibacter psychrotolerans]
MKILKNSARKLNNAITNRVIALHDQGYTHDFLPMQNQHFLCLQDSVDFDIADLNIKLIGEGFDHLTKTNKYIHTIETINGSKGLLVSDVNCCGDAILAN